MRRYSGRVSTNFQVGYAAMLEQFAPSEAVALAAYAESRGFSGVMAADHFQPWIPAQGQSAFVWNVLTAVAERTAGDFGPGVTTPTFRWHPAMVAQASATLAAMYPHRHWLGLGSGEALNEHIVAPYWPAVPERINRMFEAIEIIRGLFQNSLAGKDTRFDGEFFKLEPTRLWTMPETPPEILVATAGPITARRTGRHADGIITVGAPREKIAHLLGRFSAGARKAGKDPDGLPKVLQVHLSWASTDEEAMHNALTEWPNGGMAFPKADIRSPYDFAQMAKLVRPEDFAGRMVISADPDVHRASLQGYIDLGIDRLYIHNVGRNQREWIDEFAVSVLPKLRP